MSSDFWIPRIPAARSVRSRLRTFLVGRSNNRIIKQLGRTPYAQGGQIRDALIALGNEFPESDRAWFKRIEDERAKLLQRDEPLVDDSLGPGGLYDNDVSVSQACSVSKRARPARLLYALVQKTGAQRILELGTNVGVSSAYLGAALKGGSPEARITTLDASAYRQKLAQEIHHNLGLDNVSYVNGLFTDTLEPTLAHLGTVDLAFIDGHHQYQPTLDYFEIILKFSTPETLFVFDDIRWSDGMKQAWAEIQADDRLGFVADINSVGIGVQQQAGQDSRFVFDPIRVF